MRRLRFVCLLLGTMIGAMAAELSAQAPAVEPKTWRQFNQVFVKVIVPVTDHTPKQDGPAVEAWVAEQLEESGEPEYFAVTDWVPVCDGLLADDIVDNDVWDGRLDGTDRFCPVGGDIPQRKNGRLVVRVAGWLPGGCEANFTLPDEPGSRAVGPVQVVVGEERKPIEYEDQLPYVAIIIAPPPHGRDTSQRETP
ncbi:hypothetical protein [Roseimaritima ulvae]|uniref:Uncharacterized protein n=1 Tax=Roseimaritima ulvae TaxID=980254 RepID=A0A5B9QRC3_9BACT|nr:hypothetical protein [Roseimaritima ulvae]QEG40459.1 hypothetical protein UC8_24710 [Roseimaritima ulvae]